MDNIPSLGSISHGTLRPQDLFPAFYDEAKSRFPENNNVKNLAFVVAVLDDVNDDDFSEAFYASEYCQDAINDLQDILNEDLPPFMYFGSHPGDGSDFGYWFDNVGFEMSVQDKETLQVNDLADVDFDNLKEGIYAVAVVNDHGNVSFYDIDGKYIYGVV